MMKNIRRYGIECLVLSRLDRYVHSAFLSALCVFKCNVILVHRQNGFGDVAFTF
jgi:hypothetical protein